MASCGLWSRECSGCMTCYDENAATYEWDKEYEEDDYYYEED